MAKITAEGQTLLGKLKVIIEGEEKVEKIACDDELIRDEIRDGIDSADGWMANAYHPDAGTMLQAYAYLLGLFDEKDIEVEGDIGEIPTEGDVIY